MSSDFEDLLGPDPVAPPRKMPLNTAKRSILPEAVEGREIHEEELPAGIEFLRPVGASFIAQVAGKQIGQIAKRLSKCPVVGYHKAKGKDYPLYDFMTAMSFLVEPRGNIEDWFASKNAASLPPYVNKMFWDSAHQRNRVMRDSGDLWHTEDVMMTLGRTALTIKEESNLWIENLPERDILTNEQYDSLSKAVYRLQDMVRERMLTMPEQVSTQAMSHTIQDELVDSGRLPPAQTAGPK